MFIISLYVNEVKAIELKSSLTQTAFWLVVRKCGKTEGNFSIAVFRVSVRVLRGV